MKRVYAILMAVVMCLGLAGCGGSKEVTFRDSEWGMAPIQVKKVEGAEVTFSTANLLAFDGTFEGYEAVICYRFNDDKLYCGSYSISDATESVYDELRGLLIQQYGEPSEELANDDEPIEEVSTDSPNAWIKWERDGINIVCLFYDSIGNIEVMYRNDTMMEVE